MKIIVMSKNIPFIPYTWIYCLEQKRKLDNYFCILYYLISFVLIHIKNVETYLHCLNRLQLATATIKQTIAITAGTMMYA